MGGRWERGELHTKLTSTNQCQRSVGRPAPGVGPMGAAATAASSAVGTKVEGYDRLKNFNFS